MRIIVNAIPLLSYKTGIGQYLYHLCNALESIDQYNTYTYYYGYFRDELADYAGQQDYHAIYKLKRLIRNIPFLGDFLAKYKGSIAHIGTRLRDFDLYFEPNFLPLPEVKARKTVVTVHDLSFMLYPYWFPPEDNKVFNDKFKRSLPQIDHFLTVSYYVKKEMVDYLGIDESKISVVYNGYNSEIFKVYTEEIVHNTLNKFNISSPYILFTGTIEPRKNIISLLRAFNQLSQEMKNKFKLVIVGASGWRNSDVYEFVQDSNLIDSIVFTGYVTDEEVAHLMCGAEVFVYPSFYEGFGLPPLEAMACGTPVIVSNTTSMKELYEGVGYLIDPGDFTTITDGLYKILSDNSMSNSLKDRGLSYASKFNWEISAHETLRVFNKIMNE